MGCADAQHRTDRLELGRVPYAHVRQQRGHVERERAEEHGQRRKCVVGCARVSLGGYHPSVTPQNTPQALMAIETATNPMESQPARRRAMPRATSTVANGAKSLLKR